MQTSKRNLMIGGLATLAGNGAHADWLPATNALDLYHIHTSETLKVTYRDNGALVPAALSAINYFLRDFRNGTETEIDVALLDILSQIYALFGRRGHYEIISGFRSPRTNAALRRVTTGVSENSLHMYGRAVDVRLIGMELADLRDAARTLAAGGVGFYPDSNFVHLDTGRVRSW
jgi:uncharacterized protein YcbK (DUF882 family)